MYCTIFTKLDIGHPCWCMWSQMYVYFYRI